jgi:hypothetical protein
VKIDEKNRSSSDINYETIFSVIFIQNSGNKWAETSGQSAYYSLHTKKKPGVVLILETVKDRKYWIRPNTTIEHFNLPIDTWSIGTTAY